MNVFRIVMASCAATAACSLAAIAGPWAQPGDAQLRSDIDLLAGAGVIDNITTHWPLPWASLLDHTSPQADLTTQPDYVRDAAARLHREGLAEAQLHLPRLTMTLDAASNPDFVRGFDALGRQTLETQVAAEYSWTTTAVHIALGARTTAKGDRQILVPDGSYIAQRIDDVVVYAGYLDHWWGPGWISAMALSTNARPLPQIGIARAGTEPFESSWLSWIGPWHMEFFVGDMDDKRLAKDTIYSGLRFAFSPLPHLEIGASRTDEMCGHGHQCKPFKGYFDFANQDNDVNIVNDEGAFDIRYSNTLGTWAYEIYAQAMNEDSNPIVHSGSSHQVGGSVWLPLQGGTGRLTIEYTDSVATRDLWGGGSFHGFAYNNYDYKDGMRYRGRTLGFSLDSDSRLLSIQTSYTDAGASRYTLTLHHAELSTPQNSWGNVVTTAPVIVNMAEARWSVPFESDSGRLRLDLEARVQDDQPRPARGALATIEARVTAGL